MAKSSVKGLDDYLKYLADSPEKMLGGVGQSLSLSAQVVVEQAKANCPTGAPSSEGATKYGDYDGALRDSVRALSVRKKDGRVSTKILAGGKTPQGADIYYAHLVEFSGAQPHAIQSKTGKLTIGGRLVTGPVNHPGMRPHPFLRPALDSSETQVVSLIDSAVAEIIKG